VRALVAALALLAGSAAAVPPDLKVSTDDLNEAGEHFVEVQANKARAWPLQLLGEYSYGITDHWQVAAKLPFAREKGLSALGGGVEVRYLGAHDRNAGGYWGLDVSAGRERERPGEPFSSSVELQPVLGLRSAGWHFALNAPLAFPTSGPDRSATLGLQGKAGRRLGGHELGLEYFRQGGKPRTEYLFLAWDKVYGNELHVALGRGLTGASERWVMKLAYSFPLN
jgi:hypothetical protein